MVIAHTINSSRRRGHIRTIRSQLYDQLLRRNSFLVFIEVIEPGLARQTVKLQRSITHKSAELPMNMKIIQWYVSFLISQCKRLPHFHWLHPMGWVYQVRWWHLWLYSSTCRKICSFRELWIDSHITSIIFSLKTTIFFFSSDIELS